MPTLIEQQPQPVCAPAFQRSVRIRPPTRSLNVLRILGTCSVVALHVGAPWSFAGWIAVELFFVIAGMHMTSALTLNEPFIPYAKGRALRLVPELAVAWILAIGFSFIREATPGMRGFLFTSPFFLQNLSLPLFNYDFPRDWFFVPLWFVGALFQLQLFLHAIRKWLMAATAPTLLCLFVGIGLSFRLLFTLFAESIARNISLPTANALYCMPFTHIEAMGLGFLLGRGLLPRLGHWLVWLGLLAAGAGALNLLLSGGALDPRSFGYEWPLRTNYCHLWGYPLLAFTAAALCCGGSVFSRLVSNLKLSTRVDHILERFSTLTYGAYIFHGMIIATGINAGAWLARPHAPFLRMLLLFFTLAEAFFLAWLFQKARKEWSNFRSPQP